jgi:hypothetical protein
MSPDLCYLCKDPAAFKCLRCLELTCRECLEQHEENWCPQDGPKAGSED